MRIGTWNLAGRWSGRHASLLEALDCDVLLLTEVRHDYALPGYAIHTSPDMVPGRRWFAVVASRAGLRALPHPHGASAMAYVGGFRVCASVLPWPGCGGEPPWTGTDTASRTGAAVAATSATRPQVWGGDWNHSLGGPRQLGTRAGKDALMAATEALDLQVPTASLPHRLPGAHSIDHVAVPASWHLWSATRTDATGLSDHDAYVVETTPTASAATS